MGSKNAFLHNNVSVIYRKSILDVMIYTFIDAQRHTIPSISVDESAVSFLKKNNISEDELSVDKVRKTFFRIQKELFDEQKTIDTKG